MELEGARVGAIVHDRSLLDEPELVRSVAAAAGLAVQNERLPAQLRARVEELRASRARLIDVGSPSAAGSSATSTTAPSSASWRSRSRCGSRRPS